MKKLFTLLLSSLSLFCTGSFAQTGTAACNANFTFTITGNEVHFYPTANYDSILVHHLWKFGDNSIADSSYNPTHHYSLPGVYNVIHTVIRFTPNNAAVCTATATQVVTIRPTPVSCDLKASFRFERDSLQPNKVRFYNTTNPVSTNYFVQWNFGDGTYSSDYNATHVYTSSSLFRVCLAVRRDSFCTNDTCMQLQIQVPNTCNLVTAFASQPDTANHLKVIFTNQSTPIASTDSIRWSFGDGSYATDINPSHTYNQSGYYRVCLLIKKNANIPGFAACIKEICQTILVQQSCNLQASFTVTRDSIAGIANNVFHFTNTSTGATATDSSYWNFGDGSLPLLNTSNPTHSYSLPGIYQVCLRIKSAVTSSGTNACVAEFCKTIIVPAVPAPCIISANFSWKADSLHLKKVYFSYNSITANPNAILTWNFGDGKDGFGANIVHEYLQSGSYTVCLKAMLSNTCFTDTCKVVVVRGDSIPPDTCSLEVRFTSKQDSANSRKIYFTNGSTPATASAVANWSFGDGTNATGWNTVHDYREPGRYYVCLKVQAGSNCISYKCDSVTVAPATTPCLLEVRFTSKQDSINSKKVYFTNGSTPATASAIANWSFGDGTNATGWNTVHDYREPGRYYVCLKVQAGPNCISYKCDSVTVAPSANPCLLEVRFTSKQDSINSKKVYFTNNSTPATTTAIANWSFGDGTNATGWNTLHEYREPGRYYVCLKVQAGPNCIIYKCDSVTIAPTIAPCLLEVRFTSKQDSINSRKIYFTNNSTPATSSAIANWSFGDGTNATGWNTLHEYREPGRYYVCLKVEAGPNCISYKCDSVTVVPTIAPCLLEVRFTSKQDSANSRKIYFTNGSTPATTAAIANWSFGDGTNATGWNTVHEYREPGRYYVCLKVQAGPNCVSYKCDSVTITRPAINCDNVTAGFVYRRDGYMPNKLFFFATSNTAVLRQQWTFKKLSDGTSETVAQNDPMYMFADTGSYYVCLRAELRGGCVKEHCDVIRIMHTNAVAQCMLQAYPNPAHNQVTVNAELTQPETIKAFIYSTQNILVREQFVQGTTGNNTISINLQGLIPGFYSIRLVYGNKVCYSRFYKI